MFVYIPASWPTRLARIDTEASFSANDPWNQNVRTTFTMDNYLLVYYFAKSGDINVTPGRLQSMGGYRRVIRSKTDGFPRRLPESLAELWNNKQVPSEALPFLLHEIQPMLKTGDYSFLLHNRQRKLAILIFSFWFPIAGTAGAFAAMIALAPGAPPNLLMAATVTCWICAVWLLLEYLYYGRKRRRMRQMAWLLERHKTMAAEPAGDAPPVTARIVERNVRSPSSSWDATRTVDVPSRIVIPRRPRARIVYETATEGAQTSRELPFVVGVLGEFSGDPGQPMRPLSDRKFVQIDVDNFNEVMVLIGPGLHLRVENTLAGDGSAMEVQLKFTSMEDFEPARVMEQVPSLKALMEIRNNLRDRMRNADASKHRENVPQILPQDQQEIADIDRKLSAQLNAIMHSEKFLKLEGTWRGLNYLAINSETGTNLKIRLLNASKRDLNRDLVKAGNFDQSLLFRKIYSNEFGVTLGEPFGVLIGDYEWTNHPNDIETLRLVSNVAAAAFCPFISAAGPSLLGLDDWAQLSGRRDLSKIFATADYAQWRSFRDSEDSRFVALVVPRVLARVSYGKVINPIDEFNYEETPVDVAGAARARRQNEYCWMNAAYVMGARMTNAFFTSGLCIAIRGLEGGGRVEDLPDRMVRTGDSDSDVKSVTEIRLDGDRDVELSRLGFLPLLHIKNTNDAVFFSIQTANRPREYDRPEASANARTCARLPCLMATSRFAHYLIFMARDKLFGRMEAADCEKSLNLWINDYVNLDEKADAKSRAAKPLREARVEVVAIPGEPGSCQLVARLRPWLPSEELLFSVRVVARIPG